MITAHKGEVKLKGTEMQILTEFSSIVHGLSEHFDNDTILNAVGVGLMSPEELSEHAKDVREMMALFSMLCAKNGITPPDFSDMQ